MNEEKKQTPKIFIDPRWEAAFKALTDAECAECLADIFKHYRNEAINNYSSDKIAFFLESVVFPGMDADKALYLEKCAINKRIALEREAKKREEKEHEQART